MERFKKIIVLFWTFWWLSTLLTDAVEGLNRLHWLHSTSWAPHSNYPFLVSSLAMFHPSPIVAPMLFIGIILWELLGTILFIYASFSLTKPPHIWLLRAERAFIVTLTFWFAFYFADQMILNYDLEANHMTQGGFMFLTFLGLYLLPDKIKRVV